MALPLRSDGITAEISGKPRPRLDLSTLEVVRALVDYKVDRPGVEAQQCVKLTGTNCPSGLVIYPEFSATRKATDTCTKVRLFDRTTSL